MKLERYKSIDQWPEVDRYGIVHVLPLSMSTDKYLEPPSYNAIFNDAVVQSVSLDKQTKGLYMGVESDAGGIIFFGFSGNSSTSSFPSDSSGNSSFSEVETLTTARQNQFRHVFQHTPILGTIATHKSVLYDSYLRIYRYQPIHWNRFNSSIDKSLYCQVKQEVHISFCKYILSFYLEEDTSKIFNLVMISHPRHPIVDVSLFNGKRYRWIRENDSGDYSYSLQELDTTQTSLTDGFTTCKSNPGSNNPLIGSKLKNLFFSGHTNKTVNIESFRGKLMAVFLQKKTNTSSRSIIEMKDSFFENLKNNQDSILVFLSMVSVLHRIELEREDRYPCAPHVHIVNTSAVSLVPLGRI